MCDISFELPDTPENRKASEELKRQLFDEGAVTLYAEDAKGRIHPVMNITKHPDCPDGWYEYMLKRFLNFREQL
jgi:hypothetical protein